MSKKRGSTKWFVIGGLIAAAVAIYTVFFNGKLLYFTFGMSKDDILKTDNISIPATAADIFLSDDKAAIVDVADESVLNADVNGETLQTNIKNSVKSRLTRIASLNHMASKKGVVLGHVKRENVRKAASDYYQSLTDEEKKYLGTDTKELEKIFTLYALADEMKEVLMRDSAIEVSTDEARVISIQYICADSETDIKEAKKKLENGTPFYDVASEYNGNTEFSAELVRGETHESFEEAAYALKSGQTSDIVAAGDKYYIIKCSSDNEQSKTDANREALFEKEQSEFFNKVLIPYENDLYFEFDENKWNEKDLKNIPDMGVRFDDVYVKHMKEG